MNKKLKMLKRQIERAGGSVMISDDLPDAVAEKFLNEILSCPDCAAAFDAERKHRAPRHH